MDTIAWHRVQDCEESDDIVRDCKFSLYTKSAEFSWLANILLAVTRNSDNIHFQRWFLVAQFLNDDRHFTFEAVVNETGVIEALWTTDSVPADPQKKHFVGTVRTSPQKLFTAAQQHPYNGTPAPILASLKKCQDWFNEFFRMISPSLHLP